ncbi:MAG: orotidine 5'-phosphate decarboxylase [Candidatus Margulisbacteria bacterium GWF2_35_9]|nr:MAG: orotidine 5'-phosphate decarboxylase [Candidatus Margulisbacteria bacterium GWF2_35_9]
MTNKISFIEKIKEAQKSNDSSLIVGLDIDETKIPDFIRRAKYPLFTFAQYIIEATANSVVAYKPNIAFYEAYGIRGLEQLHKIINFIPKNIPIILDAKRGDIGNTAKMYAKSIFEDFHADAVTLSPYMGDDSLIPFLEYENHYSFVLVLTSNESGSDYQLAELKDGSLLYTSVAKRMGELNRKYKNCGAVVGATKPEHFKAVASLMPDSYVLIPGIGAQGGSIEEVYKSCSKKQRDKYLFNVSRSIIYGSTLDDFNQTAKQKAEYYREEINKYRYE